MAEERWDAEDAGQEAADVWEELVATARRTVAEVCAFTRTRPGLPAPDIQLHMGAAYFEDHGAEEYVRAYGATSLRLGVAARNPARQWYEAEGFSERYVLLGKPLSPAAGAAPREVAR